MSTSQWQQTIDKIIIILLFKLWPLLFLPLVPLNIIKWRSSLGADDIGRLHWINCEVLLMAYLFTSKLYNDVFLKEILTSNQVFEIECVIYDHYHKKMTCICKTACNNKDCWICKYILCITVHFRFEVNTIQCIVDTKRSIWDIYRSIVNNCEYFKHGW